MWLYGFTVSVIIIMPIQYVSLGFFVYISASLVATIWRTINMLEETSSIRASCIGLRNSSSQKRVTEAMMMRKMENIEKLKDERMRSSLVRCQATLHVSIIIYKLHNYI